MSRRQKTDFHKESRFFVQQGKQHLLREDFFPRGVIACSVKSHVVHDIEAVGGIHCAAAVYISGGDLFRCQSAVIAYGNVGDVEHSVEDVCGIQRVVAVQVALGKSGVSADQGKFDVVFSCVLLCARIGVAVDGQVVTTGKSIFFNAGHAVGYCDFGQTATAIKSIISNACHTVRYCDFGQTVTIKKNLISNARHTVRYCEFSQTTTTKKSIISNTCHAVRYGNFR